MTQTSDTECVPSIPKNITTDVLIIGGGATGAGVMRDLALRGIHCLLIDKKDLCAGASGGNHGLLHSGARYVYSDSHSAIECRDENNILKEVAPQCIEDTGGLFVAVEGDDMEYVKQFPEMCAKAGISCTQIDPKEALLLEPSLSKNTTAAYSVPDATVDPFRLVLENVGHAQSLNDSVYLPHTEIIAFNKDGKTINSIDCINSKNGDKTTIVAQQIVNAGGAWAMDIAKKAGCHDVNLLYSQGTLLVTNDRVTKRVINRLRPPGDGDILVPGGTVSILGTTSIRTEELEDTRPTVDEVNINVIEGAAMLPMLADSRYIRAFSRIRPLVLTGDKGDDRSVARSFSLFDHLDQGVDNFVTITGGKLTTFRLMAEKTADLIAMRLGNAKSCTTRTEPLPKSEACGWTEPGSAPKIWYEKQDSDDIILCECEMVPQSAIDNIVNSAPGAESEMTLEAIALRSRVGKGPCQGSFCGIRVASHLYDQGHYTDTKGLHHMKNFFNERFKGMQTIIWGQQMAQMELAEALHSGLLGLDCLDELPQENIEK